MKVKYTPGENGLVGRSYKVEVVAMELLESEHINRPMLGRAKIRYEDGKTEWITGQKLFDSIDMRQRFIHKRVV